MKFLALIMLMVSLLAMSAVTASADIERLPCSGQLRASDMCYGAVQNVSPSDPAPRPGVCLLCVTPVNGMPVRLDKIGVAIAATFEDPVPSQAYWSAFWRPPRVRS